MRTDACLLAAGVLRSLDGMEDAHFGRGAAAVLEALARCPAYRATPLRDLPGAARACGVGALWVKDETARFGLDSFKALGGVFAVLTLAAERAGRRLADLDSLEPLREASRELVFCAATDGNHGRSVAAGARLVGARCVIFVHEHVAEGRRALLAESGAELTVIAGHYDDAVAACRREAERNGWQLVADVAGPGEDGGVPTLVSRGYLALAHELRGQLGDEVPTHVFVQAGVGGLAAAMAAAFSAFGWEQTRLVIVEPAVAACLRLAAERGEPVPVTGDIDSVMGMLSCGMASSAAWPLLQGRVYAYLSLPEDSAESAARWLAQHSDPLILAGLSGAAGVAGLRLALATSELAGKLALGPEARVLLLATEGDVDGFLQRGVA